MEYILDLQLLAAEAETGGAMETFGTTCSATYCSFVIMDAFACV